MVLSGVWKSWAYVWSLVVWGKKKKNSQYVEIEKTNSVVGGKNSRQGQNRYVVGNIETPTERIRDKSKLQTASTTNPLPKQINEHECTYVGENKSARFL